MESHQTGKDGGLEFKLADDTLIHPTFNLTESVCRPFVSTSLSTYRIYYIRETRSVEFIRPGSSISMALCTVTDLNHDSNTHTHTHTYIYTYLVITKDFTVEIYLKND